MFTDIHVKWEQNFCTSLTAWHRIHGNSTKSSSMTKLQTVSLLKTKKKLHLFSLPRSSLPLASLTPSYSVDSLQGQWIVQKTGGRLAEMDAHPLAVCISFFLWNTLWMAVILTMQISVLSVLQTANTCPSLHTLGTLNGQSASTTVRSRIFSPKKLFTCKPQTDIIMLKSSQNKISKH